MNYPVRILRESLDITTSKPTSHKDACICMIDIVNFSKWCSNKRPEHIFDTMTLYNTFLSHLIDPFDDVEKIELVGDSVLIMAGLTEITEVHTRVKNILNLSANILDRLEYIQSIFDKDTSLRIGIHVGDVYSGFIENPVKFQLFGNSINTASRLESSSLPGTFTISESACRWFLETPEAQLSEYNFVLGNPIISCFKGVGSLGSLSGYVRQRNKALVADDDQLALMTFGRVVKLKYNLDSVYGHTIEEVFELMKRSVYEICILDVYFVNATVFSGLREFRYWEKIHRVSRQKIIIASVEINEDMKRMYDDMAEGFVNKTEIFNLDQYPDID